MRRSHAAALLVALALAGATTYAVTAAPAGPRSIRRFEAAYTTAGRWLNAGFDPRAVARAELAWWVARRMPGQNDPAQVGGLIADQYALLYEAPRAAVERAALLRAEAAAMRDTQARQPDWDAIGRLLRESYRDLAATLGT